MRAHENPFTTHRVEELLRFRPEWSGTSWEELESRWIELGRKGSIIGPHGVGKSTLLDAWRARLRVKGEAVESFFLCSDEREICSDGWGKLERCEGKMVFLDGEEQLSFLKRKKFYKLVEKAKGVIVTRHSTGKYGTVINLKPDFGILSKALMLVAKEYYPILEPKLIQWWDLENGNIRHVILRCYDELSEAIQD